jgi:C-terminal peptidase prc
MALCAFLPRTASMNSNGGRVLKFQPPNYFSAKHVFRLAFLGLIIAVPLTQPQLAQAQAKAASATAPEKWSPEAATAAFQNVQKDGRWRWFLRKAQEIHISKVDESELLQRCQSRLDSLRAMADGLLPADPTLACVQAAISALGGASEFFDPSAVAGLRGPPGVETPGVGVELASKRIGESVLVLLPVHAGPAQRAGVLAGDRIVQIDQTSVLPLTLADSVRLLRGAEGSSVTLTLERYGQPEPLVLTLQRQSVRYPSVRLQSLPEQAMYLRIRRFESDTAQKLAALLRQWQATQERWPTAVVIDLRNNPGGILDEVLLVASLLVPSGTGVMKLASREETKPLRTSSLASAPTCAPPESRRTGCWMQGLPVVVLINGLTGAGSEAFAQLLREANGAQLLGQTTAGRMEILTMLPVGADAAVGVHSANMLSPQGVSWAGGLKPDLAMPGPSELPSNVVELDPWVLEAGRLIKATQAKAQAARRAD